MTAAESTKHQRFDHRFGELAGGIAVSEPENACSIPGAVWA
jgi:hypothetical protein